MGDLEFECYSGRMEWIASLTSETDAGISHTLNSPPDGTGIVELRLDLLEGIDVGSAVSGSHLPVLATVRSQAEGGRGPNDPQARKAMLKAAVEGGAHLVDLEWARDLRLINELGLPAERIVLSCHDTNGTPDNLSEMVAALLAEPVALAKIVTTARNLEDLGRIIAVSTPQEMPHKRDRRRLIAFAMGAVGAPSRYLAPLLGAPVGFAAWASDSPAAPGQQTPSRMNAVIGHLHGPPQRLFGVVGADVTNSFSPALHGAAFAASDMPDVLLPISVPDSGDLEHLFTPYGETLFDSLGLPAHGWAVTTPYKLRAAAAATNAVPRVVRAGAANTLLLKPQRIVAENTDADGVVGSLTAADFPMVGATALVQGVGGAARGAAVGLHLAGAEVVLRGRNAESTQEVADALGLSWCEPDANPGANILVNATPLGREDGDPMPFGQHEIDAAGAVVDMVYRDRPTDLVKAAQTGSLTVVDGLTMLAYQGMAQFAAFTMTPPPRAAMLRSVGRLPSSG